MPIQNELSKLVADGVISNEVADKISQYYQEKGDQSGNRLFAIFGVIGALLIGLGLIMLVAHNWDNLSRGIKTGLSFLPLIVGQILCGYTLLKKPNNTTWIEASTTFLILAIGICMSMSVRSIISLAI